MSACTITGVFALTDGIRTAMAPTPGSALYAMVYNTVIDYGAGPCIPGAVTAIAASIHIYSPPQKCHIPPPKDHTLAFIVGQFALRATGQPALIDATSIFPISGDPDNPSYDTTIPFFTSFLSSVGTVIDNSPATSPQRSFLLSMSDGVYGSANGQSRWAKTPLPTLRLTMYIMGNCVNYVLGVLEINVHSITFGVALSLPALLNNTYAHAPVLPPDAGSASSLPPTKRLQLTVADLANPTANQVPAANQPSLSSTTYVTSSFMTLAYSSASSASFLASMMHAAPSGSIYFPSPGPQLLHLSDGTPSLNR
ncbi:hypothetical protein F5878DRAFT_667274 [Lentinula raphanica]|uniref:Uncharacterized protein n=1 Tax=Lentinula raphanica TaxID=153919 RepID=A0AA38NW47_9AGAR|nr:hypothetical protein F5878DRAFT_667274 [Lentinula raphanica]